MLVHVARWGALGSALKEDVRVRLAVSTTALPGDTHYALGAGVNCTVGWHEEAGEHRRDRSAGA